MPMRELELNGIHTIGVRLVEGARYGARSVVLKHPPVSVLLRLNKKGGLRCSSRYIDLLDLSR